MQDFAAWLCLYVATPPGFIVKGEGQRDLISGRKMDIFFFYGTFGKINVWQPKIAKSFSGNRENGLPDSPDPATRQPS